MNLYKKYILYVYESKQIVSMRKKKKKVNPLSTFY